MTRNPSNLVSTAAAAVSRDISPALYQWLENALIAANAQGKDSLTLYPLQTEASFRQFYRIGGANRALVLMDSPPAKENNRQFVAVARAFAAQQIRVPEILSHNESEGWLLLGDLGSTHFLDAYRNGEQQRCLRAAVQTLERIEAIHDPVIPAYTAERLSDELNIFVDWLVADACSLALPDRLFEPARKVLLKAAAAQPQVCVHRDFHCKNLLWAGSEVGVVDFQDALVGPSGYDLASLLHDCYWKFSDETIDAVISTLPEGYRRTINRRTIDLLAVQRQLKAIGIFARLASRDDKTSHLRHIAPVLSNLIDLCARYSELSSLGQWLANRLAPPALAWVARNLPDQPDQQ